MTILEDMKVRCYGILRSSKKLQDYLIPRDKLDITFARLLYDITNDGGVVVWVVSDQTVKGNKSLTSFRQALYFQEIGFNFYDNIIYEKNSSSFPQSKKSKRYSDVYEYCFVLTKGKIRQDIQLLCDKPNKWA